MSKSRADELYENRPYTYLFGLGDGETVIDGYGMAMYINHSCDPNCETVETDGRVWITAVRDIAPEEELTYDYMLYDGEDDEPCNCGSFLCRGSMFSPKELRRRERAAQKAASRPPGKTKTVIPGNCSNKTAREVPGSYAPAPAD